jgi:hypothetical protein
MLNPYRASRGVTCLPRVRVLVISVPSTQVPAQTGGPPRRG